MTHSSSPLISLSNAGVKRGKRWLVRGVDLELSAGEIVTLIGPNGSGKSTTAKMALGIIKPDEGISQKRTSLRVGYVPQRLEIDWTLPLTVKRFMHLTSKLSESEVQEALEATGVSALINEEVRTLSGGEFQRALIARAIARKPDLLVLDEPVQGVDFYGESALYELIGRVRDNLKCGVLMISHDLHLVMAATDRVLCLNGHVCCSGTPKAVAADKAFQDLFGGQKNPAVAFYEHSHDHTHLPDGRVQHADGSVTDNCNPDDGHHHSKNETPHV